MALRVWSTTFDCDNPSRQAEFWSAVSGYEITHTSDGFAELVGDGSFGPRLMFIKVPEEKTAKNRMHVDLGTADLATEISRVIGLGATMVGRHEEFGLAWATLLDPEGNEFCIGHHPE